MPREGGDGEGVRWEPTAPGTCVGVLEPHHWPTLEKNGRGHARCIHEPVARQQTIPENASLPLRDVKTVAQFSENTSIWQESLYLESDKIQVIRVCYTRTSCSDIKYRLQEGGLFLNGEHPVRDLV